MVGVNFLQSDVKAAQKSRIIMKCRCLKLLLGTCVNGLRSAWPWGSLRDRLSVHTVPLLCCVWGSGHWKQRSGTKAPDNVACRSVWIWDCIQSHEGPEQKQHCTGLAQPNNRRPLDETTLNWDGKLAKGPTPPEIWRLTPKSHQVSGGGGDRVQSDPLKGWIPDQSHSPGYRKSLDG